MSVCKCVLGYIPAAVSNSVLCTMFVSFLWFFLHAFEEIRGAC